MVRTLSCWSCAHCGESVGEQKWRPEKVKCEVTKRSGKLSRGYNCAHFEFKQRGDAVGSDGIPIRDRIEKDYRTRRQWEEEGRRIREGEEGVMMHSSRQSMRAYVYYLEDQTEVIRDVER